MPYYQYKVCEEGKFDKSQHEMDKCEEREAATFSHFLSKKRNKLIALLDLFFPPRVKQKFGFVYCHPTLPVMYRKRALEFIVRGIKSGRLKLGGVSINSHITELDDLARECVESKLVQVGLHCFKSYAVFDYDLDGNALDNGSILFAEVDTISFVELLIEGDILPFELLNLESVLNMYLEWNKKKLASLVNEPDEKEGWALIDAVSYAAGFYAMRSWVSSGGYINGFSNGVPLGHQPLRRLHEEPQNMTESPHFVRPKGKIDSGKLPEVILAAQERWNKVFRNACEAMKFGDINHTGGDNIKRSNTRVREKQFFLWVKKWSYLAPDVSLPEVEPKDDSISANRLHGLIDETRDFLRQKTGKIPSNEEIWLKIYHDWFAGEIDFIVSMNQWSAKNPELRWINEDRGLEEPVPMKKKTFQTYMSKRYKKNK